MIKHSGYRPRKIRDHRNYSYPHTFGTLSGVQLDVELNYDAQLTNRDQYADGLPFGCTGETTTDIATDLDGVVYLPEFTYRKTCEFEGHPMDRGCFIFNALKSAARDGLLTVGESKDNEALDSLRGKAFEVHPADGLDWFDSLRSALVLNYKRSISAGTMWPHEFNQTPNDGIVSEVFIIRPDSPWHNWKICGTKLIAGKWYLVGKSWQGAKFADAGFHYISREVANKLFAVGGSEAWTQARATTEEIRNIQLPLIAKIISLIAQWIQSFKTPTPIMTPIIPTPIPVQLEPITAKVVADSFNRFCQYLTDYEGKPGDRNYRNKNPGNFKFSNTGYRSIYGHVTYDNNHDYFAVFSTWELGMLYLRNSVIKEIDKHPTWTIIDYIALDHAPAKDGNDPVKYAQNLASRLGVDMHYPMKLIVNNEKYV